MNFLSVNQMNAQIKLNEMWKSVHVPMYPTKTSTIARSEDVSTRAVPAGILKENKTTNTSQRTFLKDAVHIWNKAPKHIIQCDSLAGAKRAVKRFVKSLPI